MTMVTGLFAGVAEAVAQRIAELLSAPVAVLDERGAIVARGAPGGSVGRVAVANRPPSAHDLRVPIRLHGQTGQVVVSEPVDGETVSPRLAQALVDLVVDQTAIVSRLPNRDELKSKFIHDLLRGQIGDESDILREAQILGMDFTRPRTVFLIDASDYILAWGRGATRFETSEALVRRRAHHVITSVVGFFNLPSATICAYIGDGEVAVLKASSSQDLAPWTDRAEKIDHLAPSWANLPAQKRAGRALMTWLLRDTKASISIGIGRYHSGIAGLARSYQDARVALSLGRRFQGKNQVHCLDELGVAAFVGISDERIKMDLAVHLLSPLDQDKELLETLAAFFDENCCPSRTANRLSIHRNTLSYRLDKIASLTGLDPRRFDDAVQVRLALLLRSLNTDAA
ncbi:MAG: helix-turn-helix domain-containing protein [Chloroflexota bacterium]|nr:helix-turn-helix domain-containing protein [Chloroflexota bacterium]